MSERFEDALSKRAGGYRAGLLTALGRPADAPPARLAGPTPELGALGAVAADVTIDEAPLLGVVMIQAALDAPAAWADLRAGLGFEDGEDPQPPQAAAPPERAGTALPTPQGVLLRPTPGEALLFTSYDQAPDTAAAVSERFARRGAQDGSADVAVAVSDGWGGVALSGSAAREVAAQVTDIDAHPAALPAGSLQRGHIGSGAGAAPALLYAPDHAGERVEFWVRRSEAQAVSALLIAAAAGAPPEAIPSAAAWASRRMAP